VLHDVVHGGARQTSRSVGPHRQRQELDHQPRGEILSADARRALIDGREIRTLTSHSLHRQMGMVQQQNFLFSGTVLDNIRLAKPDATEEEVRAAAGGWTVSISWMRCRAGLHTEVGERGAALSVGQRQLVCFTRALLADPRLVILDEATSAIDAVTEARLQKALVRCCVGRTSFVVAHRLSTIRHADLVLVLDQGRVIERGTHRGTAAQRRPLCGALPQFVQVDDHWRLAWLFSSETRQIPR
jgi:ABC-type multidrug transport system fused ATPase/permease subunit